MIPQFLKHIQDIRTPWAIAGFAIAAVLALAYRYGSKPGTGARWCLGICMLAVVLLAIAPIAYSVIPGDPIYRVRVTVVDDLSVPVEGANVKSTAPEEVKTTQNGFAELSIPAATLPADRAVTVFGSKASAFLYGTVATTLGGDHNPSLRLVLHRDQSATIRGLVQDMQGHAITGARVSVAGYADGAETTDNGSFQVNAHASAGQIVTLHVEKRGYRPVDQDHIAGPEAAVIQLSPEQIRK